MASGLSWAQIVGEAAEDRSESSWAAVEAAGDDEAAESSKDVAPLATPTAEELEDLRLGLAKVWMLGDKLRPGVDYELDLQGYATRHIGDHARRPLFKFVRDDVISRPTFAAFVRLLDNYERETDTKERVTSTEKAEESAFLDLILETDPMLYCHAYCVAKRVAPTSRLKFKELLGSLWFRIYASKKDAPPNSSGFEHVFVGEESVGDGVVGLHNWLQLWIEEKNGRLDYYGYVSHNKCRPAEGQPVLSLQFAWTDASDGSVDTKPESTSIIGSSPELEFALYTLAVLAGGKHNSATRIEHGREVTPLTLVYGDDEKETIEINVNCVKWTVHGKPTIRTCFPSV